MKRLILCFDGTWNTLGKTEEFTNVVRVGQAIKPMADNVPQIVYYNSGVGSGGKIDQILGGAFGAGIQSNVQRGLSFLAFNYDDGSPEFEGGPRRPADEVYIFGFSRGAYTARALAGVIGAIGGIPKVSHFGEVEQMWSPLPEGRKPPPRRRRPTSRKGLRPAARTARSSSALRYGIRWARTASRRASASLASPARPRPGPRTSATTRSAGTSSTAFTPWRSTSAGARSPPRRGWKATPTIPKAKEDKREPVKVEQVWFAGAHANVGGGYKQAGLSDHALVWMMSRIQDTAKLEFDEEYIQEHFFPCAACSEFQSNKGWWVSRIWPAIRSIPKRMRGERGVLVPGKGEIIDGRAHWSVKDRLGKRCLVDETRYYHLQARATGRHEGCRLHRAREGREREENYAALPDQHQQREEERVRAALQFGRDARHRVLGATAGKAHRQAAQAVA